MKVINLYAGPSSGKSTTATGIFYTLKSKYNINCEYVSEYAKVLAWENNTTIIGDQLYVTAKQNRGLERLRGKVDYAITDSPLLLGIHYSTNYFLKSYEAMVVDLFNSYDNINFFINRKKEYNPHGRFQNKEQAMQADVAIKNLLITKNIMFTEVDGDSFAVDKIIKMLDDVRLN